MKKALLLSIGLIFGAMGTANGQCSKATNVHIVTRWADSALVAWDGPIDTFEVRWNNPQLTIMSIIDTMVVVKPINKCGNINIQVLRECGNGFSQSTGATAWSVKPVHYPPLAIWPDSAKIAWEGPVDTFKVEWALHPFIQATGVINGIVDTTTIISPLQPCTKYYIRLYNKCGNSLSVSDTFSLTTPPGIYPIYHQHFDHFLCGDSLYSSQNPIGIKLGNHISDKARHNAGNVVPIAFINSPPSKYLIFGGNTPDSNLSFTTSWIDFTGGTKDAVFYIFSDNIISPNDNVTFHVSVNNGTTFFPKVYTYAGNDSNWRRVFLELAPYYSAATQKIQLTFHVDQTTSAIPAFNDILLDEVFVGDTMSCSNLYVVNRPNPSSLAIGRPDTILMSSYQWGPTGFTPGNGQFGDTIMYVHDTLHLTTVPFGTQWLYIKDTCSQTSIDPWRMSRWVGPIEIDSVTVYHLSGKVYLDLDANCNFGAGDLALQNIRMYHEQQNKFYWADGNGDFSIPTNAGISNLIYTPSYSNPNSFVTLPANCSSDTLIFNTSQPTTLIKDFIRKPSLQPNLSIQHFGNWGVRQGDTIYLGYSVYSTNLLQSELVTVNLTINPTIYTIVNPLGHTLISTSPIVYQNQEVMIPNGFFNGFLKVYVTVNPNLVGVFDSIKAEVLPLAYPEYSIADNSSTRLFVSVTAIDPNSKEVNYSGEITAKPSLLAYRINFQNLGNYPAETVRVVDTLPSYFKYENLDIMGTSHNCNISIDSNNIATFLFYNIQLPDSASDPEGSKGFIDYSIMLDQPMAVGDSVANRAHIFFDYQPAIITNWAWTKIVLPANFGGVEAEGLKFNMYPNPASTALRIELTETGKYNITLADLAGRVLLTNNIEGRAAELDVHNLPNGVYVIGIHSEAKNVSGYQRVSILH